MGQARQVDEGLHGTAAASEVRRCEAMATLLRQRPGDLRSGWLQRRNPVLAIALAGVALGLVVEDIGMGWLQPAWIPIADIGIGWLMIGCGLMGAWARPGQPAGGRLVLAGFLWFVGTAMGSESPMQRTIGFAFGGYYDLVLAWLALSFPGRSPVGRPGRAVLGVMAVLFLGQTVARLILSAPDAIGVTLADPEQALTVVLWLDVIRAASVVAAGVLMAIRLARSPSAELRFVAPVLAAGAIAAVAGGYSASYALQTLGLIQEPSGDVVALAWAFNLARAAVPLAILAGVLRVRAARAAIVGAVTDLGDAPTIAALRDSLATALGDPTIEIFTWDPAGKTYLDGSGAAIGPDDVGALDATPSLAVVRVDGGDSDPLALIVADRSLTDDPALMDAGVALTRLVIRHEAQSNRIRHQLDEVRASRVRIVEAADVERRRIERDLHDGLQQRMVALAMQLRAAETDPAARAEALRLGSAEVLGLLDDVRELARGIHPAVLSEAGLGAAIRAAADRSPVPADVDLSLSGRGSPAAQATAYYVVSESLANVAKHASRASGVWVRASDGDGTLHVEVEDDGPGGADATGHGLAGLADRVTALDGRFLVEGLLAGGTRITAELPIG